MALATHINIIEVQGRKAKRTRINYVQPDRCDKKKNRMRAPNNHRVNRHKHKRGETNHKLAVDGDLSALPHPADQHGAVVKLKSFVVVTIRAT